MFLVTLLLDIPRLVVWSVVAVGAGIGAAGEAVYDMVVAPPAHEAPPSVPDVSGATE